MAVTATSTYVSQNIWYSGVSVYNGALSQTSYNRNSQNRNTQIHPRSNNVFPENKKNIKPDSTGPEEKNKPKKKKKAGNHGTSNTKGLTEKELRIIADLKAIDTKVRRHEMAHIAAGGQYITSGAHYQYKKGPDGNTYAVAGDVSIDTSPVPGDPEATIRKMHKVQRAALAPAEPSSQDKKVAAESSFIAAKALSELMMMQAKQSSDAKKRQFQAIGNHRTATDTYQKVSKGHSKTGKTLDIAA